MSLEPQIIDVSLTGLDTKTDPFQSNGLATAANCYMERTGELRTRKGLSSAYDKAINYRGTAGGVSSSSTLSAAYALYADDRGPLLLARETSDPMGCTGLYHLISNEGSGTYHWKYTGRRSALQYEVERISRVSPSRDVIPSVDSGYYFLSAAAAETTDGTYTYRAVAYLTAHASMAYVDVFRIGDDGTRRILTEIPISAETDTANNRIMAIRGLGCEETGGAGIIAFFFTQGTTLRRWVWTTSSPGSYTRASQNIWASDLHQFDACASTADDTGIFLVYRQVTSGDWVLDRGSFTGTTWSSAGTTTLTNTLQGLGLYCFDNGSGTHRVFLTHYNVTNDFYVTTFNTSGTQLAQTLYDTALGGGKFSAIARAANFDADSAVATDPGFIVATTYTEETDEMCRTKFYVMEWDGTRDGSSLSEILSHVSLVTRGFAYATGGPPYFVLAPVAQTVLQYSGETYLGGYPSPDPGYFLVSVQGSNVLDGRPYVFVEGRMLLNVGEPPRVQLNAFPQVWDVITSSTTGYWYFPGIRQRRVTNSQGYFGAAAVTQNDAVLITLSQQIATDHMYKLSVPAQYGLYLGGTLPQIAAEDRLIESGYNYRPELDETSQATTGGSITGNATFQYRAIYEWNGPDGRLHRSAPSDAISVTTAAGTNTNTITLAAKSYHLTEFEWKGPDVRIIIYRTEASGSTYYRCGVVQNSTANPTVSFTDTFSDTTLSQQEALYTNGGELEADPPAAISALAVRDDRIFYVSPDEPTQLRWSKPLVAGLAPEFSFFNYLQMDAGGDIIALAVQDETVLVFKESGNYYVAGEGPNALGVGEFAPPRAIAGEATCSAPASVVTFGGGTFFQDQKGLHLLDRSLQMSYVGAPVENFNSSTIVSAAVLSKDHQVRFLLDPSGTALVYDYFHRIWSSHGTTSTGTVRSIGIGPDGDLYQVDSAATLYKETTSICTTHDLNAFTNWIRISPTLQGENHIYMIEILGDLAEEFRVTLYKDYESSSSQIINFSASVDRKQVRIKPSFGRIQSLRIQVLQISNSSTFRLSKISLLVGAQPARLRGLGTAASA